MPQWLDLIRFNLIDDWENAWKLWSVRLNTIGIALTAFLTAAPEQATQILASLPPEVRALIPAGVEYLPLALFVAAMIARLVKQKSVK